MLQDPFSLPDSDGYFWMRGNLHCHTTRSDGRVEPQARVDEFAEHGYGFLCLSDHRRITDPGSVEVPAGLVLVPGVELHPENPFGGMKYHFLACGVREDIDADEMAPQQVIDSVREQNGLIWAAHPYWSCVNALRDYLPLQGLTGVEVYNTTCDRKGRGDASLIWDDWMSQVNRPLPAIANDDCHSNPENGDDVFQAWTMVRVRERSSQAILDALEQGASYCSNGPDILDVTIKPSSHPVSGKPVIAATLVTTPIRRIVAICDVYGGDYPTGVSDDLFEEGTVFFSNTARWVRFEVLDSMGRKAWTNPYLLGGTGE